MHRAPALIAAFTLVGAGLAPAPTSSADPLIPEGFADHKVTLGAYDPISADGSAARFEYHAYYPSDLQVHRGDVVWFQELGTHSVTFFPDEQQVDLVFGRDEIEGDVAVHAARPTSSDCAMFDDLTREPCVLSSTEQFLNTGVNFGGEGGGRIEFDLPEGSYTYFCAIHQDMSGQIEVVDDAVAVATPAEVETDRLAQIAADTAAGEALIDSFDGPDFEVLPDGRVRWEVIVGGSTDDGRVVSESFFPGSLEIAPGDEVEFVAGEMFEGAHEFHSATFMPREQAEVIGFLSYAQFACDPDDPHSGAPGVRVTGFAALVGCPDRTMDELIYYPWAYREPLTTPGGNVVGQLPIHDSGILAFDDGNCAGACDPWTGERLPDRSDATFPIAGTFEVFCVFHAPEGMAATITVTEPT